MMVTKSFFVQTWLCPKGAWLKRNKPEAAAINENTIARMETGREVGEMARGLFGPYRNVTSVDENGRLDLAQMIDTTRAEMEKGTDIICEASFEYDSCCCAVDILRKDGDGWAIYEVKSSTDPMQDQYIADGAFQKYVLEQLGIKVPHAYIVCLDSQYVLEGDLNIQALFMPVSRKRLQMNSCSTVTHIFRTPAAIFPMRSLLIMSAKRSSQAK